MEDRYWSRNIAWVLKLNSDGTVDWLKISSGVLLSVGMALSVSFLRGLKEVLCGREEESLELRTGAEVPFYA